MAIDAPLKLYRDTVRPEWIDCSGHMSLANYVVAFDKATDAFLHYVGLGERYTKRTGCSVFALETHVTYRAEMKCGERMQFTTQLLDHDAKRVHFFHYLYDVSRAHAMLPRHEAVGRPFGIRRGKKSARGVKRGGG